MSGKYVGQEITNWTTMTLHAQTSSPRLSLLYSFPPCLMRILKSLTALGFQSLKLSFQEYLAFFNNTFNFSSICT